MQPRLTLANRSPRCDDSRTVLPPLEVEVVAGDTHKVIRPGSSSVRVDLQPVPLRKPHRRRLRCAKQTLRQHHQQCR